MGGAEYQTALLADEICRRPGVQASYLARRVPVGEAAAGLPYELVRIGSEAGVRRRAVFFDAGDLTRTLSRLQPDVLYQQAKQSYTAVCARYARKAGIPFFFHVASEGDLDRRWISLRLSANTPFDVLESVTGDWGIRHATHVIAQTDRQARILRERYGRAAAVLVRNFQPLPRDLPDKPDGPLRILWVANFKDVKRPHLFVELARSLADRSDLHFAMIGRPALQARFAPLMNLIRETPNLTYLGELPLEGVNEQMAQAAMHVNTSAFEGFPNTFIQAWARGAVVVSLAVDPDDKGMEEIGIGFCAGSMQRMREIITGLSSEPAKRHTIAQRAFEFAQQNHAMTQASRLTDLILGAARDARTGRSG